MDRQRLGAAGERLAARYLEGQGYRVVARNVRLPPWGEIDLVAERDGTLALVEVRVRRGQAFGGALASITPAKRARMVRAALAYLATLGDAAPPARIDVVAVTLDRLGRPVRIEHVVNAVEAE
jgi:putative endonuclease